MPQHIPPPSRPGLTLIELLAVIAIVAILIAIVFSVTRSTVASANRVQATANLRSLYATAQTYAGEHSGRIIPNRFQNPGFTDNWRQLLIDLDYVSTPDELERNAAILGHPGLISKHPDSSDLATFAMNVRVGYRDTTAAHHGPITFQQAEQPERTLFITSGVYFPDATSDYAEVVWPNGSVAAGTASEPDPDGQILLLFLDGHVEARPLDLIPRTEDYRTTDRLFWRGTYTSLH